MNFLFCYNFFFFLTENVDESKPCQERLVFLKTACLIRFLMSICFFFLVGEQVRLHGNLVIGVLM